MSKEILRKVLRWCVWLGMVIILAGCGIPDLPGPLGIPGL